MAVCLRPLDVFGDQNETLMTKLDDLVTVELVDELLELGYRRLLIWPKGSGLIRSDTRTPCFENRSTG